MPKIPLIREGQETTLPRLRGQSIDNIRRPRVDLSNVQNALGQLGNATKGAYANGNAFAAEGLALAEVGKAIADTGSVFGAMAVKKKQAESDIQISEAGAAMEDLRSDFETWKETNRDPSKWEGEWQRRSSALRSQLNEREGLNKRAAHEIGIRMTHFDAQQASHVQIGAAKETFRQAAGAFGVDIQKRIKSQDSVGFEELLQTGVAKGYFYKHDIDAFRERYKQEGKVQLFERIDDARYADPFTMQKRIEADEFDLTPAEKRKQIEYTKQFVRGRRFEISSGLNERIASEDPTKRPTVKEIDELGINLLETGRQELKNNLAIAAARDADKNLRLPATQKMWKGKINIRLDLYSPADSNEDEDLEYEKVRGMINHIVDPVAREQFVRRLDAIQSNNFDEVTEARHNAFGELKRAHEELGLAKIPEIKMDTKNVREFMEDGYLEDAEKLQTLGFTEEEADFIIDGDTYKARTDPNFKANLDGRVFRFRQTWSERENRQSANDKLAIIEKRAELLKVPPHMRDDETKAFLKEHHVSEDAPEDTFEFDMRLARELLTDDPLNKLIINEENPASRERYDEVYDQAMTQYGKAVEVLEEMLETNPNPTDEELQAGIKRALANELAVVAGEDIATARPGESTAPPEYIREASRVPFYTPTAEEREKILEHGGIRVVLETSDDPAGAKFMPSVIVPNGASDIHKTAAARYVEQMARLHGKHTRKGADRVFTYDQLGLEDSPHITAKGFSRHDKDFIEKSKQSQKGLIKALDRSFAKVPSLVIDLPDRPVETNIPIKRNLPATATETDLPLKQNLPATPTETNIPLKQNLPGRAVKIGTRSPRKATPAPAAAQESTPVDPSDQSAAYKAGLAAGAVAGSVAVKAFSKRARLAQLVEEAGKVPPTSYQINRELYGRFFPPPRTTQTN